MKNQHRLNLSDEIYNMKCADLYSRGEMDNKYDYKFLKGLSCQINKPMLYSLHSNNACFHKGIAEQFTNNQHDNTYVLNYNSEFVTKVDGELAEKMGLPDGKYYIIDFPYTESKTGYASYLVDSDKVFVSKCVDFSGDSLYDVNIGYAYDKRNIIYDTDDGIKIEPKSSLYIAKYMNYHQVARYYGYIRGFCADESEVSFITRYKTNRDSSLFTNKEHFVAGIKTVKSAHNMTLFVSRWDEYYDKDSGKFDFDAFDEKFLSKCNVKFNVDDLYSMAYNEGIVSNSLKSDEKIEHHGVDKNKSIRMMAFNDGFLDGYKDKLKCIVSMVYNDKDMYCHITDPKGLIDNDLCDKYPPTIFAEFNLYNRYITSDKARSVHELNILYTLFKENGFDKIASLSDRYETNNSFNNQLLPTECTDEIMLSIPDECDLQLLHGANSEYRNDSYGDYMLLC